MRNFTTHFDSTVFDRSFVEAGSAVDLAKIPSVSALETVEGDEITRAFLWSVD